MTLLHAAHCPHILTRPHDSTSQTVASYLLAIPSAVRGPWFSSELICYPLSCFSLWFWCHSPLETSNLQPDPPHSHPLISAPAYCAKDSASLGAQTLLAHRHNHHRSRYSLQHPQTAHSSHSTEHKPPLTLPRSSRFSAPHTTAPQFRRTEHSKSGLGIRPFVAEETTPASALAALFLLEVLPRLTQRIVKGKGNSC